MISTHSRATPLVLAILAVAGGLAGTPTALAQQHVAPEDFDHCKIIADDRARLDCLKRLMQPPSSGVKTQDGTGTQGGASAQQEEPAKDLWPLVRTPRPNGGPDAVAITRTADVMQSDPDLAGLIIRCQERPGLEVLLALVRPLPPRSKRDVVVKVGSAPATLHAEVAPPGTALVLPTDATAFTTGPWRGLKELPVKVLDPEGDIRGIIPLEGVVPAIAKLSASCPTG
jgi:hypothetical protein